jgi:hypothetical protein
MIGSRVTGTVWTVSWRHRNLAAPAEWVTGRQLILTGDPSGGDLLDVTRLVVLGAAAKPDHEFSLLSTDRASDVHGLAMLAGGRADRGWPADLPAGAAIADGCNHLQGRIGELGRRLAKAEARVARMTPVVEAARTYRRGEVEGNWRLMCAAVDELDETEAKHPLDPAPPTSAAAVE